MAAKRVRGSKTQAACDELPAKQVKKTRASEKKEQAQEPPRFYLMKAEPDELSVDDLEGMKNQTTTWDGVRNNFARKIIQGMHKGDKTFLYRSNCKVPGIVGIMEIVSEPYPDHTAWDKAAKYYDAKSDPENPRWLMVDCQLERRLRRVVTLKELGMHKHKELSDMALFKYSRLSVQPVQLGEWEFILSLEDEPSEDGEKV